MTVSVLCFTACTKDKKDSDDCDNIGGVILPVNVLFWTKLNAGTGITVAVEDAGFPMMSPANNVIRNGSTIAPDCIDSDSNKYAWFRAQKGVKYDYTASGNGRRWTGVVEIDFCDDTKCYKVELK